MGNIIEFDAPGEGDGGFTPLPEGTYDIEILDAKQTVSSKKNAQIECQCAVAQGEFVDRKFKLWYSLLPQATWKLKDMLDAIGVGYEEVNGKIRFDLDEIIGCYMRVNATPGEYNGKPKNDFDGESPSPLSEKKPAAQAAPARATAAAPAAGSFQHRTRRAGNATT